MNSADHRRLAASSRGFYRVVYLMLLAVASVVVVIGFIVSRQDAREEQTRRLLTHSYEARSQIKHVLILLLDAETAQRGFLLTGQDRYLDPYRRTEERLPDALTTLGEMLGDDTEQLYRVAVLRRLSNQMLAQIGDTIRARLAARQGPSAHAEAFDPRGRVLMDRIRTLSADMVAKEQAGVDAARREDMQNRFHARWIVLGLLAAVMVVALTSTLVVWAHLNRRKQLEAELLKREQHVRSQREVAETINRAQDFRDALERTLPALAELVSLKRGRSYSLHWARGRQKLDVLSTWPAHADSDGFATEWLLLETLSRPEPALTLDVLPREQAWRILLPVLDRGRAVACLELVGTASAEQAQDIANYAGGQLAVVAERQRILDSLSEALARQQAIFDSATDAILTISETGTVESFNRAAERMFGYAADEIVHRHITTLMPYGLASPEAHMANGATSVAGGIQESTARRRDASTFPVDLALGDMRLGGRRLRVALLRDASERKRLELLKNEFVSTVSHELRTPLTSIAGSLGLLIGGAAGGLSESARRLVSIAHQNCDRLVRLINDVLDIQKIEAGRTTFRLQPVRLHTLFPQVLESNQAYATSYRVMLDLEGEIPDVALRADPDRLVQVLTNLVSNAVKFSPAGGAVGLSATDIGARVRLTVRDDGPGIPEDFQQRIFSKFAQADVADAPKKGGTGLGLAISREIVQRLDGRIWFESGGEGGTRFHVELQKYEEPAALLKAEGGMDPLEGDVPILLAEPVLICGHPPRALGQVMRLMFARGGLRSLPVPSADDALRSLVRRQPAAVLVLANHPHGDALALIRVLQLRDSAQRLPVMVAAVGFDADTRSLRASAFELIDWAPEGPPQTAMLERLRERLAEASRPLPRVHVLGSAELTTVLGITLGSAAEVSRSASVEGARQILEAHACDALVLEVATAGVEAVNLAALLKDPAGRPLPTLLIGQRDPALLARMGDAMAMDTGRHVDQLGRDIAVVVQRARAA